MMTLETRGRPSYINQASLNSTSRQPQRILKESIRESSVPTLPSTQKENIKIPPLPITNNNNKTSMKSVLIQQVHRESIAPEGSGVFEKYKRRIKELEDNNSKLRNHVVEAEEAIKNYRGFLSHRSDFTSSRKNEIGCQTDVSGNSTSIHLSNLNLAQTRISEVEKEKKNALKDAISLRAEITRLSLILNNNNNNNNNKLQNENIIQQQPTVIIQPKQQQIVLDNKKEIELLTNTFQNQIKILESNLGNSKDEIIKIENELLLSNEEGKSNLKNSYNKIKILIIEMKKLFESEKQTILNELNSYKNIVNTDIIDKINNNVNISMLESNELKKNIDIIQINLNASEIKLLNSNYHTDTSKSEIIKLKELLNLKDVELEKYKLQIEENNIKLINSVPIKPNVTSQSCDPLSPMAARLIKQNEYNLANKNLTNKYNEISNKFDEYNIKLDIEIEKSEKYMSKIKNASDNFTDLQGKYLEEMKTIRHLAHVKDLGRISTLREVTLERDKYKLEVNHSK
jgi:hypothetical protein